jgi:hypothetical protein
VADRAYVQVRLRSLKFRFCHVPASSWEDEIFFAGLLLDRFALYLGDDLL